MDESILGGRIICSSGGTIRSWSGLSGGPFGPTCFMRTRPPPFFPIILAVVVGGVVVGCC